MKLSKLRIDSTNSFFRRHTYLWLLLIIVGFHTFFFFFAPSGFHASDDLGYAANAYAISRHQFQPSPHPFANRLGVTVPTALSYSLFGVTLLSSTIWELTASIITILIVSAIAFEISGRHAALFSAVLLSANMVQISYSSQISADVIVSTFMMCAAAALFMGRRSESRKAQCLYGALCALSLAGGLVSKESVVWMGPFVVGLMLRDVTKSKSTQFWVSAGVCTGFLSLAYFAGYYLTTGDWLYRLKGIEGVHNASQWSFFGRSYVEYAKRLTYQPFLFLLEHPGYAILFSVSLPVWVSWLGRQSQGVSRPIRFWAGYVIMLFLTFQFGSTSVASYNPLPLHERFLMPLLAPFSIVAGIAGAKASERDGGILPLPLLMSLGFLASFMVAMVRMSLPKMLVYALLSLTFLLLFAGLRHLTKPRLARFRGAAQPIVILVLLAVPFFALTSGMLGESPSGKAEREIVEKYLLSLQESTFVLTDPRSVGALEFYFGFRVPPNIQLVSWEDVPEPPNAGEHSRFLVFINRDRIEFLNRAYGLGFPNFVEVQPQKWKMIEGRSGVYLFEVPQAGAVGALIPAELLFQTRGAEVQHRRPAMGTRPRVGSSL